MKAITKDNKSTVNDNEFKSNHGNGYQAEILDRVEKMDNIEYVENNATHYYNGEKKMVDVEAEFKDKNYKICIELNTSCRDDRLSGKQHHANVTKHAIKEEGSKCLYILVCPSDDYYEGLKNSEAKKQIDEARNNTRCINKVNEGKGVSYIDFAIKDDQLDDVIKAVHDVKSENPKYIAKRIKKQFGM